MIASPDDTIAAIASAAGPAARGIVRVGGPRARDVVDAHFVADDVAAWQAESHIAKCFSGQFEFSSSLPSIPAQLYLWPTTRSYTGQPLAELHTIGSPPLLEKVLETLFDQGVRPARPGEFTLRAFLAGRVDLVQAEAVLGVIDAEDHEELQLALTQLAGGISGKIVAAHADLLDLLADLEAGLDFADEDIEFVGASTTQRRIQQARVVLEELAEQSEGRLTSTTAAKVVLAGLPNAGKSTLFNALSKSTGALVSKVRGTTRDYLHASLSWDGQEIDLIDTAGWELAESGIMSSAQKRREEQIERADLVVWCTAADSDETENSRDQQEQLCNDSSDSTIFILTKSDLQSEPREENTLQVSVFANRGLDELKQDILGKLATPHQGNRQLLGSTAARCRQSLTAALSSLRTAENAACDSAGDELVAMELRETLEHLGQIVGSVYTDDILDRIFSKFCIGK